MKIDDKINKKYPNFPKKLKSQFQLMEKTFPLLEKRLIEVGAYENSLILYFDNRENGHNKELLFKIPFPKNYEIIEWDKDTIGKFKKKSPVGKRL
jgi:hypothetical protein